MALISITNSEVGEEDGSYETFSLDCKGAAGDMIYITDHEVTYSWGEVGHTIYEVNVLKYNFPDLNAGRPRTLKVYFGVSPGVCRASKNVANQDEGDILPLVADTKTNPTAIFDLIRRKTTVITA